MWSFLLKCGFLNCLAVLLPTAARAVQAFLLPKRVQDATPASLQIWGLKILLLSHHAPWRFEEISLRQSISNSGKIRCVPRGRQRDQVTKLGTKTGGFSIEASQHNTVGLAACLPEPIENPHKRDGSHSSQRLHGPQRCPMQCNIPMNER